MKALAALCMILVFGFETTVAVQGSTAAAKQLDSESQRIAKMKADLAKFGPVTTPWQQLGSALALPCPVHPLSAPVNQR